MNKNIQKIVSLLLVLTLSISGCAQNAENLIGSEKNDEKPSENIIPFVTSDTMTDCCEEIEIDFFALLDEWNVKHHEVYEYKYTKDMIKEWIPDFSDTYNLVSPEECKALIETAPKNITGNGNASDDMASFPETDKENALWDIDLFFRVLKSFYGPYYYFGGDEVFSKAQKNIENEIISATGNTVTLRHICDTVAENLSFLRDSHVQFGDYVLTEFNKQVEQDYYVPNLYLYEDRLGYYSLFQDKKWYLLSVGEDTDIRNWLRLTADENGKLCYMLSFSATLGDPRTEISEISFKRGERTDVLSVKWNIFSKQNKEKKGYRVKTSLIDGIPTITGYCNREYEESMIKPARQLGKLTEKFGALILDYSDSNTLDFLGGKVGAQIFPNSATAYRLSPIAKNSKVLNMPWNEGTFGKYYVRIWEKPELSYYEDDTVKFVIQSKVHFSGSEAAFMYCKNVENTVFIGGKTGGGQIQQTAREFVLPNTGIRFSFGAGLHFANGNLENIDGIGYEPDIWANPKDAASVAAKILNYYGISNKDDTSAFLNFQLPILENN